MNLRVTSPKSSWKRGRRWGNLEPGPKPRHCETVVWDANWAVRCQVNGFEKGSVKVLLSILDRSESIRLSRMAMGQKPVPLVNIPIPTNID